MAGAGGGGGEVTRQVHVVLLSPELVIELSMLPNSLGITQKINSLTYMVPRKISASQTRSVILGSNKQFSEGRVHSIYLTPNGTDLKTLWELQPGLPSADSLPSPRPLWSGTFQSYFPFTSRLRGVATEKRCRYCLLFQ